MSAQRSLSASRRLRRQVYLLSLLRNTGEDAEHPNSLGTSQGREECQAACSHNLFYQSHSRATWTAKAKFNKVQFGDTLNVQNCVTLTQRERNWQTNEHEHKPASHSTSFCLGVSHSPSY